MNNIKPWKLWYRVALSGDSLSQSIEKSRTDGNPRGWGDQARGGAWLKHIVLATQDLDSPATVRGLTAYPALNPCREAPCAAKILKKVTSRHDARQRGADGFSVEYQYWCTLTVPSDLGCGGSVTAHHWDVALMTSGRCRVTPFAFRVVVPTDLIPAYRGGNPDGFTISARPHMPVSSCHLKSSTVPPPHVIYPPSEPSKSAEHLNIPQRLDI